MTRERPALVRPDPRDEEELRLAIESADRGEGLLMTADEAERALERAAERRGMSISGVVRFLVRQDEDKAAERAAKLASTVPRKRTA